MNYQVFEKLYFAKSYFRLTKEINNMYVPLLPVSDQRNKFKTTCEREYLVIKKVKRG